MENTFWETRAGRVVVFAGPLLWALLILFHPNPGDASPYEGIKDDVNRWLLVHVGQLVLTPFLFFAVWRLLAGLSSTAARVSRAALVVWTVFFSAYDSVQGVATGILIRHANGLAGDEQTAVAGAIDFVVNDSQLARNVSAVWVVASVSWVGVAIAGAVALHKAGAGKAVVAAALVALFVAGVLRQPQGTESGMGAPAVSVR
jgi:hypothetical protein